MRWNAVLLSAAVLVGFATVSVAETVYVKYRGSLDLAPFSCTDVSSRSSFITRVCYHPGKSYMLIGLQGTYYHYCGIDPATVDRLLQADYMGRYFNATI